MSFTEHWHLRLQELLTHTGLTQAAFAERAGITPDYISRLLYPPGKAGKKNLGVVTTRKICAAFDLPVSWFDLPMGAGLPDATYSRATDDRPTAPTNTVNELRPSDKGRKTEAVVWPFTLVTYQRINRLRQYYGARGMPSAISDIDKHLDVLVTRWENEMHIKKSSAA